MVTDFETIKDILKYCTDELKKLKINLMYIIREEKVILKLWGLNIENIPIKSLEVNLAFSSDIFSRYSKDEILNFIYQEFITEVENIKSSFKDK